MQTAWAPIVPASHCWTFIIRILTAEHISQSWRDGGDLVPSIYIYIFLYRFSIWKKIIINSLFFVYWIFSDSNKIQKKKGSGNKKSIFPKVLQHNAKQSCKWKTVEYFFFQVCILNQLSVTYFVLFHTIKYGNFPNGFKCALLPKQFIFYLFIACSKFTATSCWACWRLSSAS